MMHCPSRRDIPVNEKAFIGIGAFLQSAVLVINPVLVAEVRLGGVYGCMAAH